MKADAESMYGLLERVLDSMGASGGGLVILGWTGLDPSWWTRGKWERVRVEIGADLTVAVGGLGTTLGGAGAGTLGDARRRFSSLGDDRLSSVSFGGVVCVFFW